MPLRKLRRSLSAKLQADATREGTITIPGNDRCNEQVTNVHYASLERMGGEGRATNSKVSCRRGLHPLNRLGLEMLLNMRSGSSGGLQSLGVGHLVRSPPYIREIRNEGG